MLGDILEDYSVLVPGEEIAPGVFVFPLALHHFAKMPAEVGAVLAAIEQHRPKQSTTARASSIEIPAGMMPVMEMPAGFGPSGFDPFAHGLGGEPQTAANEQQDASSMGASVAAVLMGPAFPLLAACCVPPLTSPGDPLAAVAAGAWAAASIDPELFMPEDEDDESSGDSSAVRITLRLREAISGLVSAGHSVADIFKTVQTGAGGQPLPYPGMTLGQFNYFHRGYAAIARRAELKSSMGVAMAVSACFGGDSGERAYQGYIDRLQTV